MLLGVYLEPCQTSLMKSVCENTEIIVAVNYFGKKACYHIETSPLILYDNGLRHEKVKVNNKNIVVFIVNFEHISHLFLVFLLLSLNK